MADPLQKLKRQNRRQMSDVAQKMVAMCLHELSAKLAKEIPRLRVASDEYVGLVGTTFGRGCAFCATELEDDKGAHVEHLDAMNRLRGGLHVAGNVVLACELCNLAKRRDDMARDHILGSSGWDSFLLHLGSCASGCRNCAYWAERLPDLRERKNRLGERRERIAGLRRAYDADSFTLVGGQLAATLEEEYRKLQKNADLVASSWVENHYHMVRGRMTT